jgi:hypothetical protein
LFYLREEAQGVAWAKMAELILTTQTKMVEQYYGDSSKLYLHVK